MRNIKCPYCGHIDEEANFPRNDVEMPELAMCQKCLGEFDADDDSVRVINDKDI